VDRRVRFGPLPVDDLARNLIEEGAVIGDNFPAVLDLARQGDERALEVLYRDLAPPVLGYLRVQRAIEPEDVASEVFISIVRGLGAFRGDEREFRSWVFTIAHHRLVDERRRMVRRVEEPATDRTLALVSGTSGNGHVEEEALSNLGAATAMKAIQGLTEDQRAVVLLRILMDLSVADVARVLDKREGAVKTLQRRALARLGTSIAPEPVS
jgi:RNA polymerase sigma factor (sigma-70 family)